MGWVKERKSKNGQIVYTAVYLDLKGHERSAGTWPSKSRAIAEWVKAEDGIARGRVRDPRRGRQRLREYVNEIWFPHHRLEATTRENYRYWLDRYILPELGDRRIAEIMPEHLREWITRLETVHGAGRPTIRECMVVVNAILTTAFKDQVTEFHAGRCVKTPTVAKKIVRVITVDQFDAIMKNVASVDMALLIEVAIETGLRWGELTELRPKDIDFEAEVLTVSRAVVELKAKERPTDQRFLVKDYPKDGEWREISLARHLVAKIKMLIEARGLGPGDLLFAMSLVVSGKRKRPAVLPDPMTLGWTEVTEKGRQYRHGTTTAYQAARCRCQYCKDVMADYRASRRQAGKDRPPKNLGQQGERHIANSWFRRNIWDPAVKAAKIVIRATPKMLRAAHASWLLAGGADLQTVKDRLGHGSISTTEKYLGTLPSSKEVALNAMDAIRGSRDKTVGEEQGCAPEDIDPRDSELAELRAKVGQLKTILGAL